MTLSSSLCSSRPSIFLCCPSIVSLKNSFLLLVLLFTFYFIIYSINFQSYLLWIIYINIEDINVLLILLSITFLYYLLKVLSKEIYICDYYLIIGIFFPSVQMTPLFIYLNAKFSSFLLI